MCLSGGGGEGVQNFGLMIVSINARNCYAAITATRRRIEMWLLLYTKSMWGVP